MESNQAIPSSISFIKENYKTHIHNYNNKNNCNIYEWVDEGELIKIEEWHFINKENFQIISDELQEYLKIVDLKLISLNQGLKENILSYCEKEKWTVSEMANDYFKHFPDGEVFEMPLFSICHRIIEQPAYVIKAADEYDNQDLVEAQKTYYIHNRINAKIHYAMDKFDEFNIELEELVNYQLARGYDKTIILNLFLFTEQFINRLKYYRPSGINYFESPLFKKFFTSILNYKKRYIHYHGDFDFENINEILNLLNSIQKNKKNNDTIPISAEFQNTNEQETLQETENDFMLSTIEDWLYPFKEETILTNTNYNNLVTALKQYFENGNFPKLDNQINVKKVNMKRFGWALNEIFRANTNNNENLPIDYLKFAKENISIFKDVSFDENDYLRSNLYKYFTTKTQ